MVLPLIQSDVAELFIACADGKLNEYDLKLDTRTAATAARSAGAAATTAARGPARPAATPAQTDPDAGLRAFPRLRRQ